MDAGAGFNYPFLTRKERDNETGLDYFGARYYGSVLGRWTSTDPLIDFKRSTSEPQAWNQYQYCINNPLNRTDPDGRQDSLELQTTREELLAGRMSPEVYVDRQQKRGIGAAIGAGIVIGGILVYEAPAIITAMVSWMTRNPNTVNQLAQDAVQMSTGSPAPASVPRLTPAEIGEFGTSIANSVKTGGSRMAGIAARVSECGLSQAEAVGVTQSAVKGIGLESVAAVQKNGTVIVASVMAGTNKPVLIVNQQGVVSQGIATIKAGIRKGKEFFEVSNVVPK